MDIQTKWTFKPNGPESQKSTRPRRVSDLNATRKSLASQLAFSVLTRVEGEKKFFL
jgi:hypothetical protein